MRIVTLDQKSRENILSELLKRDTNNYDSYSRSVQEIVGRVKEEKDKALFAYTRQLDGADIDASNIRVTEEEIREARAQAQQSAQQSVQEQLAQAKDQAQHIVALARVEAEHSRERVLRDSQRELRKLAFQATKKLAFQADPFDQFLDLTEGGGAHEGR